MKNPLKFVLLLAILNPISTAGYGADQRSFIEFKEKGAVDWTAGVVEAKGVGVPATFTDYAKAQAPRQETITDAINKARHNLLETIVGLRINSENRVIDILENYPSIMIQLKDMVRQAPEIETLRKYLYDGTVEAWSQMKINGGFSQLILPSEIRQIEPIKQVLPSKNPTTSKTRSRSSDIYTGMVVDARGIQAVPVLSPVILDEKLAEVFGPAYVSREFAVQRGIVRYTSNISQAKYDSRVSDNPLIVKALKTLWPGRCDLIISNADAAKLRSASEHLVFLKKCRVIIVLDPL
jgi:hypothetical protein